MSNAASRSASNSTNPEQLYEAFSWFSGDARAAECASFYELTHDIAKGVALVLDLVVTSSIEDDAQADGSDVTPIFKAPARETLLLFAKASARMLRDRAENEIANINRRQPAGVRVELLRTA